MDWGGLPMETWIIRIPSTLDEEERSKRKNVPWIE